MKTWSQSLRDGAISGSLASILSTAVLAHRGKRESGTAYAPANAISHWFFGDRAAHQDGPSVRYTVSGYAIHHVCSIMWASIYEKFFGQEADRKAIVPALAGGAAVAALACFVDYRMTPERLQPGFEKRLSSRSLVMVYASVAVGLALRGLAASRATRSH
jgi:hypothetical protein